MLNTIKEFIELMKEQKKQIYFSIFLSFIDGCFLVVPIITAYKIMSAIPELGKTDTASFTKANLNQYIIIMILCVLIRILLRYLTLYFRSGAGYQVMCEERKHLGQELRKVSLGYLNERNLGNLVSTITSDAAFLEIEGIGVVEKVAVGFPTFIIGLGILWYFDYRIFLLTVILLIPTWFAYKNLATKQDKLNINRQEFIGEVTEDTVEFVGGLHVLKTYNMSEKQFSKTVNAFRKLRDFSINVEFAHIPPGALFQFCFRLITTGIVFLSGLFVIHGDFSFSTAFLLMLASFSLFAGIEAIGIFSIFSKMTQQSIDRMNQIKEIPKMQDISGNKKMKGHDIVFDNVTFSYDTRNVLENISFTVPENTTTALVGLSGSGKTTITNLIARFWDIKSGNIFIGNEKIKDISYENLLANLSFVFQDVFLFHDTIFNNIKIGNPKASMEEIYQAAKQAGCHEFIEKLENGYDTVIGEGGSTLSGGEKQKLSIARAILKNAPILLLDEPSSNLDAKNESLVQIALSNLIKGKTVIMIAHRLKTIQKADQILVLDNGKIKECGTHIELIKSSGLYAKLWKLQNLADDWKVSN